MLNYSVAELRDNKCFIIVYILFLVTKNGANINKKLVNQLTFNNI